jgi:hypothetical protein
MAGAQHEEPKPGEVPENRSITISTCGGRLQRKRSLRSYPRNPRPYACTLDRVVPIGQQQTAGEVMVTLTSLELYEEGLGVLRYLVYYEEDMFEGCYRIANPELVVRMCLAANCPGQYEALAAVQAKRTATWRFATCRRRES